MIDNHNLQIRDPFVLPLAGQRQGEGLYYLYGSTDSNIWGKGTGFNAYTGKDLEHWEGPFPVFRPGTDFYAERNFWAPEVYEYGGSYLMFATFRRKDNDLLGTAVLISQHPLGPFLPHSEGPVTPADWSSLDGTLHLDHQGQPWMVFCHEWQQTGDGGSVRYAVNGGSAERGRRTRRALPGLGSSVDDSVRICALYGSAQLCNRWAVSVQVKRRYAVSAVGQLH